MNGGRTASRTSVRPHSAISLSFDGLARSWLARDHCSDSSPGPAQARTLAGLAEGPAVHNVARVDNVRPKDVELFSSYVGGHIVVLWWKRHTKRPQGKPFPLPT